jgi:hypothetical protein
LQLRTRQVPIHPKNSRVCGAVIPFGVMLRDAQKEGTGKLHRSIDKVD